MASTYELILQATDKASGPLRDVEKGLSRVEKSTKAVNGALKVAGGAILAFATGSALRGIVDQYTAFERYKTVLATYLGSQEKANQALKELQVIANNLPQDLDDITNAFVTLNRFGIDTSAESLTAFSNIATANGKSLTQLAEAVADGMAGEFERFKEFGIKVTNESGKLTAAIGNDVVATSNNTTDLINQLQQLGNTRFGDAAKNNADTLGQSLSNLRGAITEAAIAFGEGLAPGAKAAADQLAILIRANKDLASSLGAGVGEALKTIASGLGAIAEYASIVGEILKLAAWAALVKGATMAATAISALVSTINLAITRAGGMMTATAVLGAKSGATALAVAGLTKAFGFLLSKANLATAALYAAYEAYQLITDDGGAAQHIRQLGIDLDTAKTALQNFAGTKEDLDKLILNMSMIRSEAKKVLSTIDTSTTEGKIAWEALTRSLLNYNLAVEEAKSKTAGLGITVSQTMTPGQQKIRELDEAWQDNLKTLGILYEALGTVDSEMEFLSIHKDVLIDKIMKEIRATEELMGIGREQAKQYQSVSEMIKAMAEEYYEHENALQNNSIALQNVQEWSDKTGISVEVLTKMLKEQRDGLLGVSTAAQEAAEYINLFGEEEKLMAQSVTAGTTALTTYEQALNRAIVSAREKTLQDSYAKDIYAELVKLQERGIISTQALADAERSLGLAKEKKNKATKEELSTLEKIAQTKASQLADEDAIMKALSGESNEITRLAKKYKVAESEIEDALWQRLETYGWVAAESKKVEDGVLTNAEIIRQGIKTAGDGLTKDLATALRTGEGLLDTFENAFNNMLDNILQAIIEKNITGPLIEQLVGGPGQKGLGGILGSFFGGAGGGGFDFGSIFGGIGSWFKGLFGGFFADGGQPPVGKVSVVGERGPELFVPSTRGTIVPNEALNNGSGTQVINFNINAVDTQTGVEFLLENKPTIVSMIQQASNSRGRRGILD